VLDDALSLQEWMTRCPICGQPAGAPQHVVDMAGFLPLMRGREVKRSDYFRLRYGCTAGHKWTVYGSDVEPGVAARPR
jgi:hypothetical protein